MKGVPKPTLIQFFISLAYVVAIFSTPLCSGCSSSSSEEPTKGSIKELTATVVDKHWSDTDKASMVWLSNGSSTTPFELDPANKATIYGALTIGRSQKFKITHPEEGMDVVSDVDSTVSSAQQETKDHAQDTTH